MQNTCTHLGNQPMTGQEAGTKPKQRHMEDKEPPQTTLTTLRKHHMLRRGSHDSQDRVDLFSLCSNNSMDRREDFNTVPGSSPNP